MRATVSLERRAFRQTSHNKITTTFENTSINTANDLTVLSAAFGEREIRSEAFCFK